MFSLYSPWKRQEISDVPFLYTLKTSENVNIEREHWSFPNVFKGYRKETLFLNALMLNKNGL